MIDIAPIIQQAIDAGKPYIIPIGSHYIGSPVYISLDDTVIIGSLPTNKGTYLWTDKPIDMFRVKPGFKPQRVHISGFTAKYVGAEIYGNECAVFHCGGYGDAEARFGIRNCYFNYDVMGDSVYMRSRWNKKKIEHPVYGDVYINWRNPEYDFAINKPFDNVDNYTCSYTGGGAHGFWIDYNNDLTERTSWCHGTTVKGHYSWVNTALKVDKVLPDGEMPINSMNVELKVDYPKTFFFLRGIGRSKIQILGQNGYTRHCTYPLTEKDGNVPTWEEIIIPYYFIDKCSANNIGWFAWDRAATGRSEYGGFVRGDNLDWTGWGTLSKSTNIDAYYQEGLQTSGPHVVNTGYNQEIYGKKAFNNIEVMRYGEINVVDGAELKVGNTGELWVGDSRIRPRAANPTDLDGLLNQLDKAGIIRKKE